MRREVGPELALDGTGVSVRSGDLSPNDPDAGSGGLGRDLGSVNVGDALLERMCRCGRARRGKVRG